jgi:hypothetical protein
LTCIGCLSRPKAKEELVMVTEKGEEAEITEKENTEKEYTEKENEEKEGEDTEDFVGTSK